MVIGIGAVDMRRCKNKKTQFCVVRPAMTLKIHLLLGYVRLRVCRCRMVCVHAMWKASSVARDKSLVAISHYLFSPHYLLYFYYSYWKLHVFYGRYKFLFRFVLNCNRINFALCVFSFFLFFSFSNIVVLLRFVLVFHNKHESTCFQLANLPVVCRLSHAHAAKLCRTSDQSSSCLITINNKLHTRSARSLFILSVCVTCMCLSHSVMLGHYTKIWLRSKLYAKKKKNRWKITLFCTRVELCNRNAMTIPA